MKIIKDATTIDTWVKQKQTNEQMLLRRLNEIFARPAAYDKVKMVVLSALEQMIREGQTPAVLGALDGDKGLPCWRTIPGPEGLPKLVNMADALQMRGRSFDINDLSNLIRVIGGWLEKGGGHGGYNQVNFSYRPGVGGTGTKPNPTQVQNDEQTKIWGPNTRTRDRTTPQAPYPIPVHLQTAWVAPPRGFLVGTNMLKAKGQDLTKKMDLLFGLTTGATISGTTTDTVMVLEAFGAGLMLHPGYYLFPVATIAASLHHTLVEAGLALALDDVITNYHIGFFSTLLPKGGVPRELSDIPDTLRAAENAAENRFFILWYSGGSEKPVGLLHFDQKHELEGVKRLMDGKQLLVSVPGVSPLPTASDVGKLITKLAPALGNILPQELLVKSVRTTGR